MKNKKLYLRWDIGTFEVFLNAVLCYRVELRWDIGGTLVGHCPSKILKTDINQ